MNTVDLSIKSVLKKSFEEFKKYFWFYSAVGAIYSITNMLLPAFSFLYVPVQELQNQPIMLLTIQKILLPGFFYIIVALFSRLILIGLLYQVYLLKQGKFYNYKQIYQDLSWNIIGRMIVGTILYSVGVFLGFIALIIPGIILALIWCLWPFIIFEGSLSAWQSLGESYKRTKKYQLEIFFLLVISYFLESCIIEPIFFLTTLLGTFSTGLWHPMIGSVLGFSVFNVKFMTSIPSFFVGTIGFFLSVSLSFIYFFIVIFGKIFTTLVIAEIYYRLSAEQENEVNPELT